MDGQRADTACNFPHVRMPTVFQPCPGKISASGIVWWKSHHVQTAYDRGTNGLSLVFAIRARIDFTLSADKMAKRQIQASCTLFTLDQRGHRSCLFTSPDTHSLHLLDQRLQGPQIRRECFDCKHVALYAFQRSYTQPSVCIENARDDKRGGTSYGLCDRVCVCPDLGLQGQRH